MSIEGSISYLKKHTLHLSEQDLRVWELITSVPRLTIIEAYVCACLNLLFPGVGTMLSNCLSVENTENRTQLFVGVAQLLTSWFFIGWVLSIYWGFLLVKKALPKGQQIEKQSLVIGAKSENIRNF